MARALPWGGNCTHLQYALDMHLSQLENVEGTDSISFATLRAHSPAKVVGLIMREYRGVLAH